MTKTIVEITPGPSLPTTFSALISQPSKPSPSVMPPVALVEIQTAAELIPGPPGSPDTPAMVLAKLVQVDGSGSGLDADLLDGQDSSYYLDLATHTGTLSDAQHGNRAGGSLHAAATASVAGFMAAADKAKLDGIEAGAGVDQTPSEILAAIITVDGAGSGLDADRLDGQEGTYYLDRANHTGTQPFTTITGTISDAQHGNRAGGSLHPLATPSVAGFLTDVPTDGIQYVRKDGAWAAVVVPPGTVISDTPPPSPLNGAHWWESDTGRFFIFFVDAGGGAGQWVEIPGSTAIAALQPRGDCYLERVSTNLVLSRLNGSQIFINGKNEVI